MPVQPMTDYQREVLIPISPTTPTELSISEFMLEMLASLENPFNRIMPKIRDNKTTEEHYKQLTSPNEQF